MSHAETSATPEQAPSSLTLLNVSDALVRASDEAPVFVYFAAPQGEDKEDSRFRAFPCTLRLGDLNGA